MGYECHMRTRVMGLQVTTGLCEVAVRASNEHRQAWRERNEIFMTRWKERWLAFTAVVACCVLPADSTANT